MEEKRKYFRVKNTGNIKVQYEKHDLYVIDISPAGAHVIAKGLDFKNDGEIELHINHFSIKINYQLIKKEGDNSIVSFQLGTEFNDLLQTLKNIRDATEPEQRSIPKENYPTKKVSNFARINSLYSFRLYELMQQYVQVGFEVITLEDLRQVLGIESLKTYLSYPALKKNIIHPSIQEINEKTDLTVVYVEIKEGKKVVAIRFMVTLIVP